MSATAPEVLDARLSAHEQLCGTRHAAIDSRLDRIDTTIRNAAHSLIGAGVALIMFLGGQLYMLGIQPQLVANAAAAQVAAR